MLPDTNETRVGRNTCLLRTLWGHRRLQLPICFLKLPWVGTLTVTTWNQCGTRKQTPMVRGVATNGTQPIIVTQLDSLEIKVFSFTLYKLVHVHAHPGNPLPERLQLQLGR
jgi:hypothetical protein